MISWYWAPLCLLIGIFISAITTFVFCRIYDKRIDELQKKIVELLSK